MAAITIQSRYVRDDDEVSSNAAEEEYSIIHVQYSDNRVIRKIPTGQIYKQTLLSKVNFLKGYKIKIAEEKLYVGKHKDIYLLSRDAIRSHRSKYKFLHIGLVQFSIIKPSPYIVVTSTASISLRDSKYTNLKDSVLVSLESDVRQAIKFNWFPNFSAPLSDLANSNALVVTIEPEGSEYFGAELVVNYRVCYKLMKTSLKPKYLFKSPVLEVNTERTNVLVPNSNTRT